MRAIRSAWEPSLLWKVTLASGAATASMPPAFTLRRSFSQKNSASERRAASTRPLPARIVAPSSAVSRFATVTNFSMRPVAGFRTEKNFWCSFIEVCRTSGGRSRNFSPMGPISTTGHSTRPATSASRPLSSTTSRPWAKAICAASCQIFSARSAGSSTTFAAASFAW